jgi:hypothetical protein
MAQELCDATPAPEQAPNHELCAAIWHEEEEEAGEGRAPGGGGRPADRAEEIRRLTGMTPEQFARALGDPLGRSLLLQPLIAALDNDSFDVREKAQEILTLALDAAPHLVLPVLMAAGRNAGDKPEQQNRLATLVDRIISRRTTENGITRDGLGRVVQFSDDGFAMSIEWNRFNPTQIDTIFAGDGNGQRWLRQHALFRRPDGDYDFRMYDPLNQRFFPPAGVVRANDIRYTGNFLEYNRGGRFWHFHWIVPPQRPNG